MMAVSGDLADMIPVIDQVGEPNIQLPGIRNGIYTPNIHRPAIEHAPYDGSPFNQPFDLVVGQLSLIGYYLPNVVMTGPDRAVIQIQNLVKPLICQMSHSENHGML